jgi:hypothetical protein
MFIQRLYQSQQQLTLRRLNLEEASTSEKSVKLYQTTESNNLEDSHLLV